MEIVPIRYFDVAKRYWRRRRYQRLNDAMTMKKKLKIAHFGAKETQQALKIKKAAKGRWPFVSPFKLVTKFHEAYVDAMVRLSGNKKIENFAQKRLPKGQPAPLLLSALNNEVVDTRMALHIYNRVASTHNNKIFV